MYQRNYGYFITKTKDSEMEMLVKKFNKVYGERPTKIKIRFFDEKPFSIRNARYNQSGAVCYCMQGENIGKQKIKNKWQDKECLPSCEYAMSVDGQKPVCMQEGTLKFLLPDISLDRVWILKIRGVTVIDKIYNYITTQNVFGNSITGDYYLYLTKEKQTRVADGKSFTNVVLDIIRVGENEINTNIQTEQSNVNLSTNCIENVEKTTIITVQEENKNTKSKKQVKNKNIKPKEESKVILIQSKENVIETAKEGEYSFDKCYSFLSIEPIVINKNGKELEYMQGIFIDMQDNQVSAIMNDNLYNELINCDLGTILELDFVEKLENKWIINSKFVQKHIKKVAV